MSESRTALGIRLAGCAGGPFRAVLFDVDGTLYDARPMRRTMLRLLAGALLRRPRKTRRVLRALAAYRRALEELRARGECAVRDEQLRHAASASGVPAEELAGLVADWMDERPLRALAASRRPGLVAFLEFLRERAVPCGAFSDYPVARKLDALGVRPYFAVELDAGDARIGVLKPGPKGLLVAAELLGVAPAELLYVGDRAEVDAAAAEAAGCACVLIGRGAQAAAAPRFADYSELHAAVEK